MLLFDPRWLTSTVSNLLSEIVSESAFDRFAILTDALMEAGCEDEDLLVRLRSDQNWAEQFAWFKRSFRQAASRLARIEAGYSVPARNLPEPAADEVLSWLVRWSQPECVEALATVNDIVDSIGGYSGNDSETPLSFSLIMNGADDWAYSYNEDVPWSGDYVVQIGSEDWRSDFPMYAERFWKAWETLTGRTAQDKGSFFDCSC